MNWLKTFADKYPLIVALLIIVFLGWLIWWMAQPIEIIYDPDAPPFPQSMGGDDYH